MSFSAPVFTASELSPKQLFDLLGQHTSVEIDNYSLGVDAELLGERDIWLTDPYGCDRVCLPYTLESAERLLLRISAADPSGTERDSW